MSLIKEVGRDIWQITVRQPSAVAVHCYLIKRDKVTLIDTGHNSSLSYADLMDGLTQLHLSPPVIDQIVLTHCHLDHYGGLVNPLAQFQAKVIGYQGSKNLISNLVDYSGNWRKIPEIVAKHCPEIKNYIEGNSDFYKKFFAVSETFTIDKEVQHGDIIDLGNDKLSVVYTPGHGQDHMCLFHEETGILFGGDTVLDIGPPLISITYDDVDIFLRSLDKLYNLPINVIFPGHGSILEKPKEAILNSKKRVEMRMNEIFHAIEDRAETLMEVAIKIGKGKVTPEITTHLAIVLTFILQLEKQGKIKLLRDSNGGIEKIETLVTS